MVDGGTEVIFISEFGRTRMQGYADPDGRLPPILSQYGFLSVVGGRKCLGGIVKHGIKGIAHGLKDTAVFPQDRSAEQRIMFL